MAHRKATTRAVEEAQKFGCNTAKEIRIHIGGGSPNTISKKRHKLARQGKGPALPPKQAESAAVARTQGMMIHALCEWIALILSNPSMWPALLLMPPELHHLAPTGLSDALHSCKDTQIKDIEPVILIDDEAEHT